MKDRRKQTISSHPRWYAMGNGDDIGVSMGFQAWHIGVLQGP